MKKLLLELSIFIGTCMAITNITFFFVLYICKHEIEEMQFKIICVLSVIYILSFLLLLILALLKKENKNESNND